jgi:hypothetical protein
MLMSVLSGWAGDDPSIVGISPREANSADQPMPSRGRRVSNAGRRASSTPAGARSRTIGQARATHGQDAAPRAMVQ